MPVYRIQGPDGRTYRVEAGSEQTALSGLKADFDAKKRRPSYTAQDAAARGVSAGLSDITNAGMSALVSQAPRLVGRDPGYGLVQAYRAAKGAEADAADAYAKAHPIASTASGLLGGLAMPGGQLFGKSATPVAKGLLGGLEATLRGAGIGGALGGLYGAATARPGETGQSAARGATVGAITGGAVPAAVGTAKGVVDAAGAVGRTVVRAANKASGGTMLSPTREAGRRLVEAMKRDGLDNAQIKVAQNEWLKNGVTPSLLDIVGRDSQTGALLRGAAMSGGGRKVAGDYAGRIAGNLQDEAIGLTRRLTPDEPRSVAALREALEVERSTTANRLYPTFQSEPVAATDIGTALQGRSGQVALARARNIADTMRDQNAMAEIDGLLSGNADTVSAGTLDLIRRGLRDAGVKASQSGDNTLASGLAGRSSDIEGALMGVQGFNEARNAFRGTSQAIDALDVGANGLNAAPEAFAAEFGALPSQAVSPGQVGYREAIETAIGRPTEGATGVLNRLATSTNQGRNLSTAFGDEAAGSYQAGLGNLIDQVQNARFIDPGSNSQTAARAIDAGLVDQQPIPRSIMGVVSSLIDKVRAGATLTDAERQAIVEMGTANVLPPEVTELLLRAPRQLPNASALTVPAVVATEGVYR